MSEPSSPAQTPAPEEAETPAKAGRARLILSVLGVTALVGGGIWLVNYETTGKYLEDTNDATIQVDSVVVSPRIAGYVAQVLVTDNQDVKAGTPLVRIDARDFQAKSSQASAQIEVADALIASAKAGIGEQEAAIEQARAQLVVAQAKAAYDAEQVRRYTPLVASGAEQGQQLAQLRSNAQQSAAQVRAQQAAILGQQRKIASLQAQIEQAKAQGAGGKAQLAAANVDVDATLIRASEDGRIGDKTVTPGQYVQAGTRLMTLVPLSKIYVTANFKETQLELMRPGQPVKIKVDALGGRAVNGTVESMAPGTGAQFSLIPPSNATGNFTKIVQRVPVRIRIDADAATRRLLVPGLSVTTIVNTKAAKDEAR
ncbi:HlyD family secretion protein [Novosphingobium rosa]|uniref:HlyD family secretion protein n=1 Tax=Novosphingobium rosa TaxID=76978 RepID=UPI000836B8C5|nr:HlyD family secretion protein [Novosphingobium rosa]